MTWGRADRAETKVGPSKAVTAILRRLTSSTNGAAPDGPALTIEAKLRRGGPRGARRADLLERYAANRSHATLRDLQLATLDILRHKGS